MINVVIDSTILRNDPARKKAAFCVIKKLANAGELKIHIPEIVKQEFLSQQIDQYHAGVLEIVKNMRLLSKKNIPQDVYELLKSQQRQLSNLGEELSTFAKADFEQWVSDLGAQVHPILASYGPKVMEAYFSGNPPFRKRKNRDDIPDAFIWQTIVELVERFNQVYVVSNDTGIRAACKVNPNTKAFATLDELISSDVCQTPLKRAQAEANLKLVLSLAPEIIEEIKSTIESEGSDSLSGRTVTSEEIPDDNNEGMITLTGGPEDIEILTDDAKYFGEGLFVIPATFISECTVNYSLFKGDFYALSEKKVESISISDLNDHYYEAEEDFNLWVKASIALNFGGSDLELEGINKEQLTEIARHSTVRFDSIEEIEVLCDSAYE